MKESVVSMSSSKFANAFIDESNTVILTGNWDVVVDKTEFFNQEKCISVKQEKYTAVECIFSFQANQLAMIRKYDSSINSWTEQLFNYYINADQKLCLVSAHADTPDLEFYFTLESQELKLARRLDDSYGCLKTSFILKRNNSN